MENNNPRYLKLDQKVFNMAPNLFGTQGKPNADQFTSLPKPLANDGTKIYAVYPTITSEAFSMTMDNYRNHVAAYNFKTVAENEANAKYNLQIDKFLKENPLTEIQRTAIRFFHGKYRNTFSRVFNEEAEKYNLEFGMIIKLRKIQTVKPSTELVFQNFLHLYNTQLMKRNTQYMRFRITTPRPIEAFKVNAHHVTSLKRGEFLSLDLCKKTIRSHRERMEEAGILVDYHFSGAQRPVEMQISPTILVVLDMKTSKFVVAENQHVTPPNGKVLPDNNDNTRTIINECEIKENVKNHSQDKEFPAVTPFSFVFYKNTSSKEQKENFPPPPPGVKFSRKLPPLATSAGKYNQTTTAGAVINENFQQNSAAAIAVENGDGGSKRRNTISDQLESFVIHNQDLAEGLARGDYNNYTPIDMRWLEVEAYSGTLLNEQFRTIALQDFFKNVAKLYKNSTPFAGSWKKAINLYFENKFISFTGNAFNKSVILDDIKGLRWRLEHVRKYSARNPDWQMLFPAQYFDFSRLDRKEGGFEYTKKAHARHEKYKADAEVRKRRNEAAAELRKKTVNYSKKCETEIRKFFKQKITFQQLIDYVDNNLPSQFKDQLPKMIERMSLKFNVK